MGITSPSNTYGSRKTPVSLKVDIEGKQAALCFLPFSWLCSRPRFVHRLASLLPCFPTSDARSVLTLDPISCIWLTTKTILSNGFQVAITKFTKVRATPSVCVFLLLFVFFPFHCKRIFAIGYQTFKALTRIFNISSENLNYLRTIGSYYFYIHYNTYQSVCLVVNSFSM